MHTSRLCELSWGYILLARHNLLILYSRFLKKSRLSRQGVGKAVNRNIFQILKICIANSRNLNIITPVSSNGAAEQTGGIEMKNQNCSICGTKVDIENLHPDSLDLPTDGSYYSAAHTGCANGEDRHNGANPTEEELADERAWITQR